MVGVTSGVIVVPAAFLENGEFLVPVESPHGCEELNIGALSSHPCILLPLRRSPAFDIFRMNTGKAASWVGSAETMREAILKAKAEMAVRKSSYMIWDAETGERKVIAPSEE